MITFFLFTLFTHALDYLKPLDESNCARPRTGYFPLITPQLVKKLLDDLEWNNASTIDRVLLYFTKYVPDFLYNIVFSPEEIKNANEPLDVNRVCLKQSIEQFNPMLCVSYDEASNSCKAEFCKDRSALGENWKPREMNEFEKSLYPLTDGMVKLE
jgi:hypothetical protein